MNDAKPIPEFIDLLWALCDERLTAEQELELEQELCRSAAARRVYVRFIGMQGLLGWNTVPPGEVPAEAPRKPAVAAAEPPAGPLRILSFLRASAQFVPGGELTVGVLLIIAVVGAVAGLMTMVSHSGGDQQSVALDTARNRPAVRNQRAVLNQPAARLTATRECQWKSLVPAAGAPLFGQKLELAAGTAELMFGRGARVVVQGPATLEVLSADEVRLDRGKLAASVPQPAIGFTVFTPTAAVVDVGTEFGVEVDEAGATSVAVSRGAVELSKRQPGAKPSAVLDRPIRISAHQAIKVSGPNSGPVVARRADIDASWAALMLADSSQQLVPSGERVAAFQVALQTAGNQSDFGGGLGVEFEVHRPIRVFSLGVFDHLGDGIPSGPDLTVQLWRREKGEFKNPEIAGASRVLAELVFSAVSEGYPLAGHRFKALDTPIDLPPGSYLIAAYGFSERNPDFNFNYKAPEKPEVRFEGSRGALSIGRSLHTHHGPGNLPSGQGGDAQCYVAASFEYVSLAPKKTPVSSP